MVKPVIILGTGGHSKVLIDILKTYQVPIIGMTDPLVAKGTYVKDIKVIGDDYEIENYKPEEVELVNAMGFINENTKRDILFKQFKQKGYFFKSLIHKSAILADNVAISEGVQIMAGAILQPDVAVGENSLINTRAIIEHDSKIGANCHIGPGAVLLGNTIIGNRSFVGAGSVILQGIKIGQNCIIGAGAVVTKDIEDGMTVVGVPARVIKSNR